MTGNYYKTVVVIAVIVGLSIMGDSLMYSLLPLEAEALGIPLSLVGVLLSANRVIRLISNTWAGLSFEHRGARFSFIFATILGLITTVFYGLGWGFITFLLARAGWGIAWSYLRQGFYQTVWTAPQKIKGRLMGTAWGVIRLGSTISVLVGGYLYDLFGYQVAVFTIAGITGLAIPLALLVRWPKFNALEVPSDRFSLKDWRKVSNSPSSRWLLVVGFLETFFEAILISTTSLFISTRLDPETPILHLGIGTVSGVLLGVRYSANLLFGPLLGAISDRLGQSLSIAILALVSFLSMLGAVILPNDWVLLFLAIIFIVGSGLYVTTNAAASGIAARSKRPHLFVGLFTTAIDLGLALGPLTAYSIRSRLINLETLYIFTAVIFTLAAIRFWRVERASHFFHDSS
jgi:MFS family permease